MLALLIPTSPALRAQATGAIEGTVVDEGTQRPLAGAQISIVGTSLRVVTSNSGTFRLPNVSVGARQVRARSLGFTPMTKTVEVADGQTARVQFALAQSALELSAVVTTGTAGSVVEARKLGNTVAAIEPPPNAPITSFSDILQGREPGVVSLPSSGLTGEGARIRIRGNASLSQSNEPLVYIDGVRMDNGGSFGRGFIGTGGGGNPSRLDDLDPNSIEKIEVLKGAAAATLYGTEASNGVLIITTKKGSQGSARWTFSAEQATLQYPKGRIEPNFGFARSDTQATRLSQFYGQTITKFVPFSRSFATRIFETGRSTSGTAAVSGGNPLVTYYASGRYYDENGPFGGKKFDFPYNGTRIGVRTNDAARRYQGDVALGLSPLTTLRLNVRALYADSHTEVPQNNNDIYAPYTLLLFSKPERAECNRSKTSPTDPTNGVAGVEMCRGPGNPTGASTFATIREALQRNLEQDARHFNGSLNTRYLPTTNLSFDGTFGVDFTSQRSSTFLPFGNNVDFRTNQANEGDKSVDDRTHQEITLSANGTWNHDFFRSFSSSLLFGGQGFITRDNDESSNNQGFPGPGIEIVNGGSSPQVFEVYEQIVNAGYFVQEQLGFRDWIFATFGGRYDKNSAFGKNTPGVWYPKASLSVIPSDRPGWATSFPGGVLPTLRVRAALGRAGRQPSAYAKLTTYGPLTSESGGGLVPDNLGNPNLKPEVSTEWEVGTEIGLLRNRAAIDFTRWERRLKDALVSRQFPVTGGFRNVQLDNVGRMDAAGWDLKLRGFLVNTANAHADLYANTSFLTQIVRSLGGAPPLKVGGSYPRYRNFVKEGYAPGALFGAKLPSPCAAGQTKTPKGGVCLQPGQLPFDTNKDGIPDTQAQVLAFLATAPASINAIDPLAADDNNNGDKLDHYLGKPFPDYQGSFGGSLTLYRNWTVATNFEYKAGRYTITDLTGAFRRSNPSNGGNTADRARVESTILNPASTAQQRLDAAMEWATKLRALTPYDGLNQNFAGDYVRWRELSVTYATPTRVAARLGAQDLALTFAARNLKLWTKYPGVDPEVNVYSRNAAGSGGTDQNFGEAIDAFGLPLPMRFSLAVRLGF
jgi:TonB-linked SusC/RagA family outer membrane protein